MTTCQGELFHKAAQAQKDCVVDSTGALPTSTALPTGFTESVVFSGLTSPTNIEFAADGRVFVTEKRGVIKVFDNVSDSTPTVFADTNLQSNVHNFWDRGMLGLALDPSLKNPALPLRPWVYVLYTYDPTVVTNPPLGWDDACPNPPGATTDGCVVRGRLSRFTVNGTTISGPEQVLIEDWCQQFPSHSVGDIAFGPDGALYVSGGDGASFNGVDYGQLGGTLGPTTPKNPCGDPPNDAMTPPTAEGGALRSQDLRTDGAPTGNSYAATVLQDSPVAFWRLGEGSSTTAADSSGSNTGTYTGGYTLGQTGVLSGDSNTAVRFNGSTGYVSVPNAAALNLGDDFTLEAWIKRLGTNNFEQFISKGGSYALELRFGVPYLRTEGSTLIAHSSAGAIADTNWHHVVATKNASTVHIYVDGVEGTVIDTLATVPSSVWRLAVGAAVDGYDYWFNGSVDETALYDTDLSATRIQAHHAAAIAETNTDAATLDGAVLRVDPVTGAAFAGNPFASSADTNKQRIVAYGLRNPFRFELRPGTNELWLGDVGWGNWEEIDRIADVSDTTVENFGWPCYEGGGRMAGYDAANLNICENLYSVGSGAITAPVYTYAHTGNVVTGETCPTGGSAIAGMAFYPETGGTFPTAYRGGLFFADHNRSCIWWMPKGADGQPDPTGRAVFLAPAANPVDLEIGPDGALYFADFEGNSVRKVAFTSGNQPPTAVAQANPTSGPAPLTVNFSGLESTDPESGSLSYAWDLDGDGAYDDSGSPTPTFTYPSPATVTVGLRVTDPGSAADTDTVVISAGNTPPVPVINTPAAGTTAAVGELISFSGSATDAQDGTIPPARLTWLLRVQHCPSGCHSHDIQTFPGIAAGSFSAPDHDYPSYLELILTASDSNGISASTTRRIDPKTVDLSFQTVPTGLSIVVNGTSWSAPFIRTVIQGSANSITATSPQTVGESTYAFVSWSDGGAATHTISAAAPATYTATYSQAGTTTTLVPTADSEVRSNQGSKNFGNSSTLGVRSGGNNYRSYVKFTVPAISGSIQTAKLRVFVADAGPSAGSAYQVGNGWTESGITWNNAPVISGTPLSTVGTASLGAWVEFDVMAAVVASTTLSFALSGGSSDAVAYSSRTGGNSPQLVIKTTP